MTLARASDFSNLLKTRRFCNVFWRAQQPAVNARICKFQELLGSSLVQGYTAAGELQGPAMPSKRVELNADHLREARQAAANRTYSASSPLLFAHMGERGLHLRVRGATADWILRFGGKTRTLALLGPERGECKPGEIRVIREAEELARKTRALLKDGTDPKAFLTGTAAGKSEEDAKVAAERKAAIETGKWTWETLVEKYADGYLSEPRMTTRGILKQPSEHTGPEARRYLTMEEAKPLSGRLLSELRPGDLEEVRDACAKAGRKTASRQFVAYSKGALSFARKKHSRAAGLEGAPKWWLEVEKLDSTIPAPKGRHPSLQELARTLYTAEKFRTIPGRKNARETSETVLAALWFIALTAQRVTSALSLRKEHVLPWAGGPEGWKVAYFPPEVMKGRRPHSLPLPPRLAVLFERVAGGDDENDSAFVFPATRGTDEEDAPVSRWSVATVIDRLRGRSADPKAGEEFDGPDLLEGLPYFSPHDIRRTFATVCEDLTVRGDAISAVLDHVGIDMGQAAPMKVADVTRIVYDYSQRLELKRIAIEAWTEALFAAVEAEWEANRPCTPVTRPLPPPQYDSSLWATWVEQSKAEIEKLGSSPFSDYGPWYRIAERQRELRGKIREPFRALNRSRDEMEDDEIA
ncbi:MAG: hypothetical protein EOQ34_27050 [Mesorhizobium sp.]|nr:hypothetical protein [Mesorhizobium sp.]RWF67934.1 MAG: hypothetical protein EOQ34_27050 [Mesorhizobium sp.]